MSTITSRFFLAMAPAIGAVAAWGSPLGTKSGIAWRERRDLFPEGVASGDPDSNSVLLWTRRPPTGENPALKLNVEVIETEFVCIPRPLEPSDRPDGVALSYRVRFRTGLWESGEAPKLQMQILEGDPKFSL
jgi:phosphodiesterase/alkaline phosphatase D-like protein